MSERAQMTESALEQTAVDWLASTGCAVAHEPEVNPGGGTPEGQDRRNVLLKRRTTKQP